MTDDEIEHSLRALPAPSLPAEWRGPILVSARREARKTARGAANWPAVWLVLFRLFRRNPITVGGLAALWMLVLVLKVETPVDHDAERMMARAGSVPPPYYLPLREQVLLAGLLEDESGPAPMRQP